MRFFFLTLFCLGLFVEAIAADYVEGKQYQRVATEVSDNELVQDLLKEANHKVQVLEFFSYGCHWCFKLDPYVDTWIKTLPDNVDFQRVPVEFHPSWTSLTKAYYTAVDLKSMDKIHKNLFEAVQSQRVTNLSEDGMRQFFVSAGIPEQEFTQTYDSFDVTRKQKWANAISRAYRITAIPIIVVQGPRGVFVTAVKMAGSEDEVLKVANYLINMQTTPLMIPPKTTLQQNQPQPH